MSQDYVCLQRNWWPDRRTQKTLPRLHLTHIRCFVWGFLQYEIWKITSRVKWHLLGREHFCNWKKIFFLTFHMKLQKILKVIIKDLCFSGVEIKCNCVHTFVKKLLHWIKNWYIYLFTCIRTQSSETSFDLITHSSLKQVFFLKPNCFRTLHTFYLGWLVNRCYRNV